MIVCLNISVLNGPGEISCGLVNFTVIRLYIPLSAEICNSISSAATAKVISSITSEQ